MAREFFKHGQWPQLHVRTHWFALVAFLLLLITGLLLFLPQVHTVLIPVLPLLYELHITFGILLGLALLLPLFSRLPAGKRVRRFDWVLSQTLLAAITMSGVVLWQVAFFPAAWRSFAFTLHGDFAYIMTGWIAFHFLLRLFSVGSGTRTALHAVNERVNWRRRDFLRWSAYGSLGTFVALFFGAVWVNRKPSGLSKGIPQFPEYYTVTGSYPAISAADYRLTIDGLVDNPQTLTLAQCRRLPRNSVLRNFQCVTGWVVPNLVWTGVPLKHLASLAKARPEARYITFYSADGVYTDSLSIEQAALSDVMLVYEINEQPLPIQQGYPLRLIVPEMFGYKSVKWVNRISFTDRREIGYWEHYGYAANANLPGHGPQQS
ncbi:MAG: molybdopterin-dependent oxidoreductase [Bacilli bacterium]